MGQYNSVEIQHCQKSKFCSTVPKNNLLNPNYWQVILIKLKKKLKRQKWFSICRARSYQFAERGVINFSEKTISSVKFSVLCSGFLKNKTLFTQNCQPLTNRTQHFQISSFFGTVEDIFSLVRHCCTLASLSSPCFILRVYSICWVTIE